MKKILPFLLCLTGLNPAFAADEVSPDKKITAAGINQKIIKHYASYSHFKIIGVCSWVVYEPVPKLKFTMALEQYLPDLTVSVYNRPRSNPWTEAREFYESKSAIKGYNVLFKALTGDNLGHGEESRQRPRLHIDETQSRIVDVVGTPLAFNGMGITLKPVTTPYMAYYLSQADAYGDRSELAELIKILSNPLLLFNHNIRSRTEDWGSEFPRLMTVEHANPFKASVVAALHAADITTNGGGLHAVQRVSTLCGKNCYVEPVVFNEDKKTSFWQEVYPNDRLLSPGKTEGYEMEDNKKGHGNYVFVVWRKYRGCVQRKGHYLGSTVKVQPTKTR